MEAHDIKIDETGNLIFKDVFSGKDITVNYNNTEAIATLLSNANKEQLQEIRKQFADNQNQTAALLGALNSYFAESDEVQTLKRNIFRTIETLDKFVQTASSQAKAQDSSEELSDLFPEIDFEELMDAIENHNCVLFIGPELSTDENGDSIHENYFTEIGGKALYFDKEEGLFHPGKIFKISNKAPKYYESEFHEHNVRGNAILRNLAHLPFKLTVSYAPDNAMSRMMHNYNRNHNFMVFDGSELSEETYNETIPTVYNALGCLSQKRGKYIYTYEDVEKYLRLEKSKKIPLFLEELVEDASHILFLGFNFNRWYYRLLMFTFEFNKESQRYVFEKAGKTKPDKKAFVQKQFGLDFQESEYELFSRVLLSESLNAGIYQNLSQEFVDFVQSELQTLKDRTMDTSEQEKLRAVQADCNALELKITNFQQS